MAIKTFSKLTLIVLKNELDTAVELLQGASAVQLLNLPELTQDSELPAKPRQVQSTNQLTDLLTRLEHCIDLLNTYSKQEKGLNALFTTRIALTHDELKETLDEFHNEDVLENVLGTEDKVRQLRSERDALLKRCVLLRPWSSIPLSTRELLESEQVQFKAGVIQKRFHGQVFDDSLPCLSEVFLTSTDSQEEYLLFACHVSAQQAFEQWWNNLEIEPVKLPETEKSPQEEIDSLSGQASSLDNEIAGLEEEIQRYATHRFRLMVVRDHVASQVSRRGVESSLLDTEKTTILQGWVLNARAREIKSILDEKLTACDWRLEEPTPEEAPPSVLETSPLAEPFQMVTGLDGLPDYREVDPTPFVAPTFALFFGICLSDVGYGLLLAAIMAFILFKFPVRGNTRESIRVLLWGGIATVLFGPLAGGYFGIPYDRLPEFLQKMVLFPASDPMRFLIFSLILGFVHIHAGLVLGIVKRARSGQLREGLFEKVPWLILLPSLVIVLFGDKVNIPQGLNRVAIFTSILSALAVVLITPVGTRHPGLRLGKGLYNLYGITSFLGDVLSYSRLMAFGLVTGGIAGVINQLAGMLAGLIPVLGLLLALVFLVAGHLFNLAVNTLGAFVHTARLHYIEFFNKFYEGSGKTFQPLRRENRYSIVRE